MIFLSHVAWPVMPPYKLLLTYHVWRIVWRPWSPFLGHQAWSGTTLRRGNVFYYVYKRFYLSRFFTFFNVFYFDLNVVTSMVQTDHRLRIRSLRDVCFTLRYSYSCYRAWSSKGNTDVAGVRCGDVFVAGQRRADNEHVDSNRRDVHSRRVLFFHRSDVPERHL